MDTVMCFLAETTEREMATDRKKWKQLCQKLHIIENISTVVVYQRRKR